MSSFLEAVRQLAVERDWRIGTTPASLIREWQGFVELCESGYPMGIDEYRHDMRCRARIEALLRSPELQAFSELPEFAANVRAIDEKFKRLLLPDVEIPVSSGEWWDKGVPRFAGRALQRDIKQWTGVEIEVR